ncbi:diguanylate cyclase [Extensimonas sp. H3M7-6]|nr:sensor domain-containing diguanylate cyclase [Extensimonas sp. H3M7-6]MDF1482987.1 diguanylate cyclase [Extensimonas sp. H3M7-6]
MRVLGMGLGGLAVGAVLWEVRAPPIDWILLVFVCYLWPHLACLLSKFSSNRHRTELFSMVLDTVFIGLGLPLMRFNLLPSALIVTLHLMDRIASGARGLRLATLLALCAGILGGGWLGGYHWAPESSMRVILACLPLLIVHTLVLSLTSRGLIEKTARQNEKLHAMLRVDALTGLYCRPFWQEQAAVSLRKFFQSGTPSCMLMLDIDHFKQINDTYGHDVGDTVLRGLAHVIRGSIRATDCAGRFGGDEFIILLPDTCLEDALVMAERIRKRVATLRLRKLPDLQITCSVGVACIEKHHDDLGEWMKEADTALYQVKKAGRDGVASAHVPLATTDAAES